MNEQPILLFEGLYEPSHDIVRVVAIFTPQNGGEHNRLPNVVIERRQRHRAMGELGWEPFPAGNRELEQDIAIAALTQVWQDGRNPKKVPRPKMEPRRPRRK